MRNKVTGVMAVAMLLIVGLIAPAAVAEEGESASEGEVSEGAGTDDAETQRGDEADEDEEARHKPRLIPPPRFIDPECDEHTGEVSGADVQLPRDRAFFKYRVVGDIGPGSEVTVQFVGKKTGKVYKHWSHTFTDPKCKPPVPTYEIDLVKVWTVVADPDGLFNEDDASTTLTATPDAGLEDGDTFTVTESDVDTGHDLCTVTGTTGTGAQSLVASEAHDRVFTHTVTNTVTCEAVTPPGNGVTPPGNGVTPPGNGVTPPDTTPDPDPVTDPEPEVGVGGISFGSYCVDEETWAFEYTFDTGDATAVMHVYVADASPVSLELEADSTYELHEDFEELSPLLGAIPRGSNVVVQIDGFDETVYTDADVDYSLCEIDVLPEEPRDADDPVEDAKEETEVADEVTEEETETVVVEREVDVRGETVTRTVPTRIDAGTGGLRDNSALLALLLMGGLALSGFGITSAATARRRR